jgi:diaminopimelate epimerase
MTLKFTKYQGTGNDFIMIDDEELNNAKLGAEQIRKLCDRRFGIGADGLIIIKKDKDTDFYVDYYNADGSQSFCGNGARCSVQFARELNLISKNCQFAAIDGVHEAEILDNNQVKLLMLPVEEIHCEEEQVYILNTGSPHFVKFVSDLGAISIYDYGRQIRYSDRFKEKGINVNIAQKTLDRILVRTYERGVEAETFSCGTGVTAVALADAFEKQENRGTTQIETLGGTLKVHWEKINLGFKNIYLEGPASRVYNGSIEIQLDN